MQACFLGPGGEGGPANTNTSRVGGTRGDPKNKGQKKENIRHFKKTHLRRDPKGSVGIPHPGETGGGAWGTHPPGGRGPTNLKRSLMRTRDCNYSTIGFILKRWWSIIESKNFLEFPISRNRIQPLCCGIFKKMVKSWGKWVYQPMSLEGSYTHRLQGTKKN